MPHSAAEDGTASSANATNPSLSSPNASRKTGRSSPSSTPNPKPRKRKRRRRNPSTQPSSPPSSSTLTTEQAESPHALASAANAEKENPKEVGVEKSSSTEQSTTPVSTTSNGHIVTASSNLSLVPSSAASASAPSLLPRAPPLEFLCLNDERCNWFQLVKRQLPRWTFARSLKCVDLQGCRFKESVLTDLVEKISFGAKKHLECLRIDWHHEWEKPLRRLLRTFRPSLTELRVRPSFGGTDVAKLRKFMTAIKACSRLEVLGLNFMPRQVLTSALIKDIIPDLPSLNRLDLTAVHVHVGGPREGVPTEYSLELRSGVKFCTERGITVIGLLGERTSATHPSDESATSQVDVNPPALIQFADDLSTDMLQNDDVLLDVRTYPANLWDLHTTNHPSCEAADQTIAVLDSGLDGAHSALLKRIRDEVLDVVSFVDGEHAWQDFSGHGTHCAGIIAILVPRARLLIGKVIGKSESGEPKALVDGIEWATARGARVLSLSLHFTRYHAGVAEAVNKAISQGVIVVCSAANSGTSLPQSIGYPAALGNVICVGSHASNGARSAFSSVGREIDFLAPGERILSYAPLWVDGGVRGYRYKSGTSMATPFVAALSAIILQCAQHLLPHRPSPQSLQVKRVNQQMCTKWGHHDQESGYGIIIPSRLFRYNEDYIKAVLAET